MFLHDIVSELTAEEARKSFKHAIKENDDDLFAPSDRIEKIDRARKDPWAAYEYARDMLTARWPAAEPVIMRKPRPAYMYALKVIKGRWPEAEPRIMRDPEYAYEYARYVIRGRWPEAEPAIMQDQDPGWAYLYAKDVIGGRWPEAEPVIKKNPWAAYVYAKDVIGGRWPEAEPVIKKSRKYWKDYKQDLNISGKLKENDDDLFAADRKTADPWVTHYIGNPIVGYARIIPDLHSRWKYDPEDLHPEEQKFYHMAGERVPVMDWSERTHFAVIMIGAAHPLRVKTWMLDNVDIDLSLRQQDNDDDELAENDDDLFTNTKTLRERLIVFLKEYSRDAESLASNEDEYEQYYREEADIALKVVDVFLKSGLLEGIHAFLKFNSTMSGNPGQMMEENTGITVADLIELKSSINEESDDDLFADRTVINPVSLARGIVQVAEEFEERADRVSTWAAAELYRDDAAILRFAARACKSGIRACMKELEAIDTTNWEYLEEVLQQDFDIDLLSLYDQYENGGLTESVTESDDDLFADRGLSIINLPKLTTPSLENLFYAFSFETRPDYLPKTRMMMRKIAREFARRGRPLSDAVLQQHDLQDEQ